MKPTSSNPLHRQHIRPSAFQRQFRHLRVRRQLSPTTQQAIHKQVLRHHPLGMRANVAQRHFKNLSRQTKDLRARKQIRRVGRGLGIF